MEESAIIYYVMKLRVLIVEDQVMFLELKCGQISLCDRRKDVDAGLVVASVATRQAREAGRENDLRLHTQEVLVPCIGWLGGAHGLRDSEPGVVQGLAHD